MLYLTIKRRSPSPAWYAIWRRRCQWLRFQRGATVRGEIAIWIPWGMREDQEAGPLAAAAAREQLFHRFPRGVIAISPGELHCDVRTTLASWRFAFTVTRMLLVARSED